MPKSAQSSASQASSEVDKLHQQVKTLLEENAHLKLLVAKYRYLHFGQKSEALAQLGQLDLGLAFEPLSVTPASPISSTPDQPADKPRTRKRKPFPGTLPCETVTHAPVADCCPDCGGRFKHLGEDVSEMLEYVPASFKVIRHVRPKLACTRCDHIARAAAPARPIPCGFAGPALLAHVLVGKFCDHLPRYRQSTIYARSGLDLERALLAEWVGHCHELLSPLVDSIRRYVLGGSKVHADDTLLPVLAPGKGRTKTARLWTYIRDDRPAGSDDPPAVWFAYSEDRKGLYALNHWSALIRYAADGRIDIDNNAAERALRGVALGRKNHLFGGSDVGGERAASMYRLIGSAKLNGIDPEAYLRTVLARIAEHPINRIDEFLPCNLYPDHATTEQKVA